MSNFNNLLTNVSTATSIAGGIKMNATELGRISSSVLSTTNLSNILPNNVNLPNLSTETILSSTNALAKTQELVSSSLENSRKALTGKLESASSSLFPVPISQAQSASLVISTESTTETLDQPQDILNNVLHNYATYTYSISLHVIPIQKYNNVITGKMEYHTSDNKVLIASGGRNNSDFSRHPEFVRDFYFQDLKMTTIVGLNSRTRNTNAIDISFTLIEPYGFTFINQLLRVAAAEGVKSWFELPFMLQIEFFGNDDVGGQLHPISETTKRIPIKLIGCKSKVTGSGAEYQIQAVPYNHSALSESTASTPAVLKVQAKTLQGFFSATESAGEAASISKFQKASKERHEQILKEIEAERAKDPKSTRVAELEKQKNNLSQDVSNTGFVVYSYAAAINSYQKQLKENNHVTYPEQYKFVFEDPTMANSKIVFPKKTELKTTPMVSVNSPGGISAIRAQAGLPVAGPDANTEIFTINAGTSIIEVINQAMRSSEYIRNQFNDPSLNEKLGSELSKNIDAQAISNNLSRPINWYKIVPVIEIQDFDEKLNKYSRTITYYIKKYTYYNTKFRDAPKALPNTYSKKYSYLYTGKNSDIIDFSIDFDTMFYTAITADKSKSQTVANQQQQKEKTDAGTDGINYVKVQTAVTHPVSGQANLPDPASVDNKSVLINDFAAASMSGSRGDMINVQLKIVGDPQFIKQDDVMYNPANSVSAVAGTVDPISNSIVFDAGEVFVLLEFRTPTDFNDTTGLMNFEENSELSVFSGLYRVLTVDNEFRQGMFVQTLSLIRLFDQPAYDTVKGSEIQNNQRSKEIRTPLDQQTAARARTEFAKTDERRLDIKNITDAAKARADFAAVDPRRVAQEAVAEKTKVESVITSETSAVQEPPKKLELFTSRVYNSDGTVTVIERWL